MADSKITALPATTTLLGTDILPVVTDPGGTATNKKITQANLAAAVLSTATPALPLAGGTMSGDIAMAAHKVSGLAAATANGDALRYEQLNNLYLLLTGGTLSGDLAMGTHKVSGLAAATVNGDALRYEQLVGLYLLLAGGTMSGDIAMGTHKVTGLGNGSGAQDAVALSQLKVLQIVVATNTTPFSTTSSTFQTTNCTATIVPTSASSKILIIATGVALAAAGGDGVYVSIFRDSVNLGAGSDSAIARYNSPSPVGMTLTMSDAPASTSSLVYSVKICNDDNSRSVSWNSASKTSMILIEVIA